MYRLMKLLIPGLIISVNVKKTGTMDSRLKQILRQVYLYKEIK